MTADERCDAFIAGMEERIGYVSAPAPADSYSVATRNSQIYVTHLSTGEVVEVDENFVRVMLRMIRDRDIKLSKLQAIIPDHDGEVL